jgi:amino acid transporter
MGEGGPKSDYEFVPRIGTFFVILGIFALIFFMASEFADQTDFDWLFAGLVLMGLGFFFRRRAAPPPASDRFSSIRKMRENAKKRKEERTKK